MSPLDLGPESYDPALPDHLLLKKSNCRFQPSVSPSTKWRVLTTDYIVSNAITLLANHCAQCDLSPHSESHESNEDHSLG